MRNQKWKMTLPQLKVLVAQLTNCHLLQADTAADHANGYPVLARTRSSLVSGDTRPNALVWERLRQSVFAVRQTWIPESHDY
jgi:hypothetical protein